ncbi:MAG: hypothetical protein ACPLRU_01170 [Desulfofundulus sp.]
MVAYDKQGWAWLINSRKWHYFIDGKSLCGKYLLIGSPELEQGNDDSPENCAACRKALKKLQGKQ